MSKAVQFGVSFACPPVARLTAALAGLRAEAQADNGVPVECGPDYRSTVMTASRVLEEAGCEFGVSGFGNPSWGVDGYDMSTFFEGLWKLLIGLSESRPAVLDFYAPGLETEMRFVPRGDSVEISCSPGTDTSIDYGVVHLERLDVTRRMFGEVARAFAIALEVLDVDASNAEPFLSWKQLSVQV
ncbi:hypothetical protein [Actinomadura sp. 6N118]|uniref:hypothetical protein n=1 Tax=Actinomadura sp. 6N118 TaxID=3375151 RepID=UPI0037A69F8F